MFSARLVRVISCALLIDEQDGFCLSVVFFPGPAVFHSHQLEVANVPRIKEKSITRCLEQFGAMHSI